MDIQSYEEYKEVRQKIKAHLAKKAEWLSDHWLEAHEDLMRDQFAEDLYFEPEEMISRLISELDNVHRKLFDFLSGKEIVDLLRSKLSDTQIVDVLTSIGETHKIKTSHHIIVSSFRNRSWDEEVFTDDDRDLADLVSLLPDDSIMKKDMFTVNVDIGPFYFSVKADTFLKEVEHLINAALADGCVKELLETGSDA